MRLVCSSELKELCHLDEAVADEFLTQFNALDVKEEPVNVPGEATSTSSSKMTSTAASRVANVLSSVESNQRSDSEGDYEEYELSYRGGHGNRDSDDDSVSGRDYTACSAEDCGYCGKCMY